MIKTVHIQNFKCLLDAKVDLGALTVLVGPNDSGKTSFLEALNKLGKTTQNQLTQVFGGSVPQALQSLVWQKKADRNIVWNVYGEASEPFEYRLELQPLSGHSIEWLRLDKEVLWSNAKTGDAVEYKQWNVSAHPDLTLLQQLVHVEAQLLGQQARLAPIVDSFASTEVYHLNPQAMRTSASAARKPVLSANGDNLAAVLNEFLTGPDRPAVNELEGQLHEAISSLRGLSTPGATNGHGERCIEFTLAKQSKPPITIPAGQTSDGAILLTAFLALAYTDTPRVLLVEEPENGLHPSQLKRVIDLLRKISTGEVGNQARQVILTTHSPLLLNFVQPEEVRIFRRDDNGATQVTPMDKVPNIERLQKEFAPGELWHLFGEDELLSGQPA